MLFVVMSLSDDLLRVRGFTVIESGNCFVVGSIRDDAWVPVGMEVGSVITGIGAHMCSGLPLHRICELLLERVDGSSSSSSSSSSSRSASSRCYHKVVVTARLSSYQAKRSADAAGLLLDDNLWRQRGFKIKRKEMVLPLLHPPKK